jgi:hypothetical protein
MPTITFNIQDLPKWLQDDEVFRKNYIKGIDQDLESFFGSAYKPAFVFYDQDSDSLTYSVEVPEDKEKEFLEYLPLIGGETI